ncbi:hypothetical protein [Micromonospora sp. CB01531]|uniref:hypothetical protein n=1 Tax=Micromonospora sp. CB01531 TaxID=1718947 RepID=UPI000939C0B1|nr:hypothetical protein [Micromonospora sp. CB01531]OKI54563.1 hypothetical protein A6A27_32060 [Micromonospora sp. CB01531]
MQVTVGQVLWWLGVLTMYAWYCVCIRLFFERWPWPWPILAKSSGSSRWFRWRFPWRLRDTGSHLVLERKRRSQLASYSRLGASVNGCGNCEGCDLGLDCDFTAYYSKLGGVVQRYYIDPYTDEVVFIDDLPIETPEELERRRAKEYQKHIASLDKLHGAIRMFRTWRLMPDGTLRAMTQEHTWEPGENVTLASGPNAGEDSGFYGFSTLDELKKQEKDWWEKSQSGQPRSKAIRIPRGGTGFVNEYWYVCGTMLCYGHCKMSAKGGRVQKAIPEYIIEPDGSDPDFGMLVVNAAEKYGVRIVSVEQAENLENGVIEWWRGRKI